MLYEHHVTLECGHIRIVTLREHHDLVYSAVTCNACTYQPNGSGGLRIPRRTVMDCAVTVDESSD